MVIMKVIIFIALYLLIVFLEKRDNNYLCGSIFGLVAETGMMITWLNALLFGSKSPKILSSLEVEASR